MSRRPRTTIRRGENCCPSKGEYSLLLWSSIHVVGWRKPCSNKEQRLGRLHARHTLKLRKRMQSSKKRPIWPRTRRTRSYQLKQLLISARKRKQLRNIQKKGELPRRSTPKSATTKKSAERRSVSQLPQADTSPNMPPALTKTTMAECSWWDIEKILCQPLLRLVLLVRKRYGSLTLVPQTIWHLIKNGFESFESQINLAMSRPEMIPLTPFEMSAMFHLGKKVNKLACTNHHEEFGLSRPNCGARHASPFQPRWLLHREGKPTHFLWSMGRPNVYPRVERGEIGHVCKEPQIQHRYSLAMT